MGRRKTDAELGRLIKNRLMATRGLEPADRWKDRELAALYRTAHRRRKNGKTFFGHGNFHDYAKKGLNLPDEINVLKPAANPAAIRERLSNKQLHERIGRIVKSGARIDSEYWGTTTGLRRLYQKAQSRKKNGKSFFGYGGWYEYLQKRHGVISLTRKGLYDEQLHYLVAKKLAEVGEEALASKYYLTPRHLQLSNAARRRNFFGKGGWRAYLQSSLVRKYLKEIEAKKG